MWIGLSCLMAVALLAACDSEPERNATPEPTATPISVPANTPTLEPSATPISVPANTPTPEPTATPISVPTNTPTPEPTATPGPLTSVQIFDKVSPAVAFIETAISTGSGVSIGGGYVVTNAHVVWPYHNVRVRFPDGSEFGGVPVKGMDLLADLAVLGPIDAVPAAVALVNGESLPIGADVFLIGYPGEIEKFPQPAIVRGLLSRVREWESIGITYLQTDAPVIGGQSGGALVSEMGEVVGISGFAFTEGDFGIVASSSDISPRIRQIVAGEDPSGLGDRRVTLEGGNLRHEVVLENFWDQRVYVVNEPSGAVIDIEFAGDNDGAITVYDSFGTELLYLDNESTGAEVDSFVIGYHQPHFLITSQLSDHPGDFVLTGSHRLTPIHDPDDGKQIHVGQSIQGNIDFPGDMDHFLVYLTQGDKIEVVARSTLVDTFLTVDYPGAVDEQIIIDDDSGGGLFGVDSTIVYRAPHTGIYLVVVEDATLFAPGGYVLTTNVASPDALTTLTTRVTRFRDSDATLVPSTSSDFGLSELRSAFDELPDSFEEGDPVDFELSLEGLNLEDYFGDLVAFVNADPFEMIVAASGHITDSELTVFDKELSSATTLEGVEQGFILGANMLEESVELHESGLLPSSTVGASSFGAYLDFTIEDTRLRMEFITFRRGNLAGVVYVYTLPDAQTIVSVDEAARLLDLKMSEIILAR